jgi:hypothetical protein
VDLLRRIVTWLAPGGWLVLEEPDFGMWIGTPTRYGRPPPRRPRSPSRAWPCPRAGLCSARFTSSASRTSVQTPRSTSSRPALILPSSTSSATPLSPLRRCKLARSASSRRRQSPVGQARMTSWRADSSKSAYGAGGPRPNDPELRRCHYPGRHRRSHAGQQPCSATDLGDGLPGRTTNSGRSAPALGSPAQRSGSARHCGIRTHHSALMATSRFPGARLRRRGRGDPADQSWRLDRKRLAAVTAVGAPGIPVMEVGTIPTGALKDRANARTGTRVPCDPR